MKIDDVRAEWAANLRETTWAHWPIMALVAVFIAFLCCGWITAY